MVSLLVGDAFFRGLLVGALGLLIWLGGTYAAGVLYDISTAAFIWARILSLLGYAFMIAGPAFSAIDLFMGIGRVLLAEDPDEIEIDPD